MVVRNVFTDAEGAASQRQSRSRRSLCTLGSLLPTVLLITIALGTVVPLSASCGGSTVCTNITDFRSCLGTNGTGTTCTLSNTCTPVAGINSCGTQSNVWQVLNTSQVTNGLCAGGSCSAELVVSRSNLTIQGQGSGSTTTTLQRDAKSHQFILAAKPGLSNLTITNLHIDGNNQLWQWENSHANLESFLTTCTGSNLCNDVNLNTTMTATVYDVTFENSTRNALEFYGTNVTVEYNTFISGLDGAVVATAGATGYLITGNDIGSSSPASGYRGGAIGIFSGTSGTISSNTLVWNASGDVDGRDIGNGPGSGGQIGNLSSASGVNVTNNTIDGGAYLNGGNMAPPYPSTGTTVLINYGIEINSPAYNCSLSGNTAKNHGVSGYWLDSGEGSSTPDIKLSNESATSNKLYGIIINGESYSQGIFIEGGSASNNGGGTWYNGSSDPTGYGVFVQAGVNNSACIQSNVTMSGNTGGAICGIAGNKGNEPTCDKTGTNYYQKPSCP